MAESQTTSDDVRFRQIAVLVVEGLGVGAGSDEPGEPGRGCDTLGHLSAYVGGLELPFLQWLGLGCLTATRGVEPAEPPAASVATIARRTKGTDLSGGLRELFGTRLLSNLLAADLAVSAVGPVTEHLGDAEMTLADEVTSLEDVLSHAGGLLAKRKPGLVIAGVRSDAAAGGPIAVARQLQDLDAHLPALLDSLDQDTMIFVVGVSGADATLAAGTNVLRAERTALIAYTPAIPSGVNIGVRSSLADLGATIAENFAVSGPSRGASFFEPLVS